MADGGSIAGWFIDSESIYQTFDGTRDKTKNGKNNIKTELNSAGMASVGTFDYSIITDAINATMASIGGVLMSGGLINGYSIATVAAQANYALARANEAYERVTNHTHAIRLIDNIAATYKGQGCDVSWSYAWARTMAP